jgi:hypothetical protein
VSQQQCATDCGRPTTGSALCRDCEETFVREIGSLAGLADDLRAAITRQAVFDTRYGGVRTAAEPVLFDDRATRARSALMGAAWRWTFLIWDRKEPLPVGRYGGLVGMGRWLHQRINRLLDHPGIGELANDVHRQMKRAARAVDRPLDRVFAGVCSARTPDGECPAWLYASPDRPIVTCRSCGAHWDVAERRDFLLAAVEHVLATTDEIASAVVWLGDGVKEERIRQWASRGRLAQQGEAIVQGRRRPLYRIGDVLRLLEDDARRQASAS